MNTLRPNDKAFLDYINIKYSKETILQFIEELKNQNNKSNDKF